MNRICSVKDCSKPFFAKGYCSLHWQRVKRNGDPLKLTRNEDQGLTKHPLYKTYMDIKYRCLNQNCPNYNNYGGRGIEITESWLGRDGFKQFVEDMGPRPIGTTIDRINVDGNYEPSNCRWATAQQQVNNRRIFKKNKSGHTGVYFHKRDKAWYASICINYKLMHLGKFSDFSEALAARLAAEVKFKGVRT